MLPCLVFEDDHLLVVNKPPGLNTHSPAPFAGEGIYEWLKHREPRWASLAIIHRLDKETSGLLAFGKSPTANRALTEQFSRRTVRKRYLLLTDRPVPAITLSVKSALVRSGEKYLSRPLHAGAEVAETRFYREGARSFLSAIWHLPSAIPHSALRIPHSALLAAEPLTGRTHQIRAHAAARGFPILGDTLYGGTPAARVYLHAAELTLAHPVSGKLLAFSCPPDFEANPSEMLRALLLDPAETNAYRLVHGATDGSPGWYLDRLGDYLLSQSEQPLTETPSSAAKTPPRSAPPCAGAYHKLLTRDPRRTSSDQARPQLAFGSEAPARFTVLENGLRFELSFEEGYSVGLFLDQRDNRRRLLTGHVAADFPLHSEPPSPASSSNLTPFEALNTFAYTCGFSVCAAKAGARTTSLDLSKKYLEWGKRNFALNQISPDQHDFIFGDVFDWLRRLAKKRRSFNLILLDPPTFSQSREFGAFRAEKDYGRLVTAALPLLQPKGMLFASCNTASWPPAEFVDSVEKAVTAAGKKVLQRHYAPQPPDFPISRAEPAYLKTLWLRVG